MKRTKIKEAPKHIGEKIKVAGWINSCRSHGKIIFIDIRDESGVLQTVFLSSLKTEVVEKAKLVRDEWVVEIEGEINKRPGAAKNKDISTGEIEMAAESINILSEAKTPPFPINGDGYDIKEEKRLEYRYLDLRRKRMKDNIIIRQQASSFIRNYLIEKGFIEIETPILTKSTPEGARDFLVPSRIHKGEFYALPQSPQQYKQLLMVAGFEKYFQFPHVFRDEDLRADRLFEHTQLDIEMSFIEEEDVFELIEGMMSNLMEKVFNRKIKIPFPRISYDEAIGKYKTDKPDLRKDKNSDELAFSWTVDFPMFEILQDGSLDAVHHPFTSLKDDDIKIFEKIDLKNFDKEKLLKLKAKQYDLVLNGVEIMGGSIRTHKSEILKKTFEVMGHSPEGVEKRFGHILEAFKFGVPPHGGIAAGFDRLLQTVLKEKSIRETVAFPTTTSGNTAVMDAPSFVDENQLKELGLKLRKEEQ
ncbi:aspartate--tRNA ligase [Patescibacteria group bacterium]|nr:aspartate--tRNA ligase [Patescibacteria group bacterium]MBU4022912.1 aspartate--tRNA ligase [Patescibacteria group bacterium]MBU4078364.1 aspartate--tRNA ligase [Patescibacteria group bacterium]